MRELPWRPGLVVADRYRLDDRLGDGAAAEVWRALDSTLDAPVAVKLLHPDYAGSAIAKRFLREAQTAAQLRSLHVVQILDHGLHDGVPYIVMELLEGETLAQRLDRVGKLAPPLVARILGQIAKAAGKAHAASIIHRDLKPPNVFLVHDDDAEEEIAKVFDFGIAKLAAPAAPGTDMTTAGTLLGTPEYMSPEQAMGAPVDFRSDLYAMGIIACECLTGEVPFPTTDIGEVLQLTADGKLMKPSALGPVPRGFDGWFARATKVRPEERFASAKEMYDALRVCLSAAR